MFALTNNTSYSLYRKAIWLYIFLLIMEGALRKWLFPSLATPLLLVREPIVVWLVIVGWQRGWLEIPYVKAMAFVSIFSFVMSLLFGHHNLWIALFGWRIYFFHFPMIFIIGKLLTRNDLLLICRFFLYVSIPMTVLIVVQFYSPPTAWVNIGIGGEGTAGGMGAEGFMRPPGTFSFPPGFAGFHNIVGCILFYYLIVNNALGKNHQIPQWALMVILICYLIAIPTSISRTIFFQSCVLLGWLLLAAVLKQNIRPKIKHIVCIGGVVVLLLLISGLLETNISAFTTRFETANKIEGGIDGVLGDRYLGGMLGALLNIDIPFWGYGIGLGTNAGAKLLGGNMFSFGFNGEQEWERIIGESGFVLGIGIIAIRLFFSLALLKRAYYSLKRNTDLLSWMLAAGMLMTLPQGQMGVPTNLGFCVLLGGLTLAAINTSRYTK